MVKLTNLKRVNAIDEGRGTAMLFVFLSHFVEVYFLQNRLSPYLIYHITMVASPTFMLISGIMLGFLFVTNKDTFAGIRETLVSRGLFLLTIGRVLMTVAHVPIGRGFCGALSYGLVTDAIGVSVVIGPAVVRRVGAKGRLLASIALYVVSGFAVLFWSPSSVPLAVLKEYLVGPHGDHVLRDVFPILPWFSLYLVGSCIGEKLGKYHVNAEPPKASRFLLKTGLAFLLGATVVYSIGRLLVSVAGSNLSAAFAITQKLPPSPAYFLFYGGLGLLLLSALFKLEEIGVRNTSLRVLQIVGQNSLFVFIIQYYMYFTIFSMMELRYVSIWPLYFVLSVWLICLCTWWWHKCGFSRYLRIPYRNWAMEVSPISKLF